MACCSGLSSAIGGDQMSDSLRELRDHLARYGEETWRTRTSIDVSGTSSIDQHVPTSSGVYWVETTMPAEEMRRAISEVLGKEKRVRKHPPNGTTMIKQTSDDFYIVYSGTEENMNKRLKQHLFNQGHAETVKLGCIIDDEPFSNYSWRVSFHKIESYEIRYAVEAWWRLKYGWPTFCLK